MIAENVLCSICTYKRYDTTLPLALMSIVTQEVKPKKVLLYDDNEDAKDLREVETYKHIFNMLTMQGIEWEVVFGEKKGQHFGHQTANSRGFEWVWRLDDDTIAEPNVLKNLLLHTGKDVGAVGGSIITPPGFTPHDSEITALIKNINTEPNIQWYAINRKRRVEHLHCSFLYRAGVVDYNLGLSRVAHREETLFTWQLHNRGYKLFVIPDTVTWHLKSQGGGIRAENNHKLQLYEHDERIFNNLVTIDDKTIVVLNCGMGDHVVFKKVLPEIKNPVVFTCYPEIVPGRSIAEAIELYGDTDQFNIYKKMDKWNWTDSLENAFRKLYVK